MNRCTYIPKMVRWYFKRQWWKPGYELPGLWTGCWIWDRVRVIRFRLQSTSQDRRRVYGLRLILGEARWLNVVFYDRRPFPPLKLRYRVTIYLFVGLYLLFVQVILCCNIFLPVACCGCFPRVPIVMCVIMWFLCIDCCFLSAFTRTFE